MTPVTVNDQETTQLVSLNIAWDDRGSNEDNILVVTKKSMNSIKLDHDNDDGPHNNRLA